MGKTEEFELGQGVALAISGERGTVIGKASYLEGGTQYQVHYQDVNGAAKTEWLHGGQLLA